jgi:hypothetical protein
MVLTSLKQVDCFLCAKCRSLAVIFCQLMMHLSRPIRIADKLCTCLIDIVTWKIVEQTNFSLHVMFSLSRHDSLNKYIKCGSWTIASMSVQLERLSSVNQVYNYQSSVCFKNATSINLITGYDSLTVVIDTSDVIAFDTTCRFYRHLWRHSMHVHTHFYHHHLPQLPDARMRSFLVHCRAWWSPPPPSWTCPASTAAQEASTTTKNEESAGSAAEAVLSTLTVKLVQRGSDWVTV